MMTLRPLPASEGVFQPWEYDVIDAREMPVRAIRSGGQMVYVRSFGLRAKPAAVAQWERAGEVARELLYRTLK